MSPSFVLTVRILRSHLPAEKRFRLKPCIYHPEIETSYRCTKYGHYLCEACLECRDPKLYCKHRSACPIWFLQKENGETADRQAGDTGQYSNAK